MKIENRPKVLVAERHLEHARRMVKDGFLVLVYENRNSNSPDYAKHRQFVAFDKKRHGAVPALGSAIQSRWCKAGQPWEYLLVATVEDPDVFQVQP